MNDSHLDVPQVTILILILVGQSTGLWTAERMNICRSSEKYGPDEMSFDGNFETQHGFDMLRKCRQAYIIFCN